MVFVNMHAYLLIGSNKEKLEKEIKSLNKKESAKLIEFPLKKIADVRELGQFTKLHQGDKTAILLRDVDGATTEALNAFLKNLEEPQENVVYFLTARNKHNVLPTIVSRCLEIKIGNEVLPESDFKKIKAFFNDPIERKFSKLSKITQRDQAISFMEKFIAGLHTLLIEGANQQKTAKGLRSATTTLKRLKANGNVNLQLTNFVLTVE